MKELVRKVEKLEDDVERLQSQQSATGGGGGTVTSVSGTAPIASSGGTAPVISLGNSGVVAGTYTLSTVTVDIHGLVTSASSGGSGSVSTASLPLAITGSNIALNVTTTNNGGAVALQGTTPGVSQTGNINVSGKVLGGTLDTNASGIILLSGTPMLQTGSSFPVGGLVNGQRYRHDTYKSWFVYDNPSTLWRQEAPGVFSGSFPTVSAGDNTVAPGIEVKRIDRNITYFWDGTRWLSSQPHNLVLSIRNGVDFAQTTTSVGSVIPREHATNGIYLTAFEIGFTPRVAQSGSLFYTLSGAYIYPSNSPANVALTFPGTTDTKLFTTINTNYAMPQDYITPIVIPAAVFRLGLVLTPTGAAGAFLFEATASYRLIGG